MLNNPIWTDASLAPRLRDDPPETRTLEVRDILAFLRRRRARILACALAGAALGALYALTAAPVYTARAQLVIDSKMPPLFAEPGGDVARAIDTGQIANQIAILRSEKVARMVIDKLGLRGDLEFGGAPPRLPAWLTAAQERLTARLTARLAVLMDEARGAFRGVTGPGDGETPDRALEAERRLLDTFAARLDVRRAGLAYALDISFSARDPQKAADIVNAVVEQFLREKREARIEASRFATDWLNERVDRFRAQMNAAIRAVQEFRASHNYRIRRGRRDDPDGPAGSAGAQITGGQQAAARAPADDEPGTLEELESAAETSRKVYESLLVVLAEAVQRQSAPVADSRVITAATRPLFRSNPGLRLTMPAGAAAGAGLFVMAGLAGLLLDGRARSRRQIRAATGRDCLGWIPRRRGARRRGLGAEARLCAGLADGLQWTRLSLAAAGHAAPLRTIGLTAAGRTCGRTKALAAVELARLYAASGSRALVIDADAADPVLRARPAEEGIGAALCGRPGKAAESWRSCVTALAEGCDVLPLAPETLPSPHWLGSPAMEALLASLCDTYDVVIVDLPPVGRSAAILALAPLLDGVVLMTEWGRTPLRTLTEACETLENARARILGTVTTEVDRTALDA
ncbi:Wzz/FepE/Etk N-terminal domain-containing protein [Methylobacterium nonmethylotrophicum]|uniref:Wzz/FepE/Etk N-terminal domain-containing protein n=1 Tax=Methylobacterium nonmethylotrophicum TaxID=1141884 RepID=UPI001436B693|nr:Wzz/FepE/Etk N-terminal domain-containing protein [Methylobacterium nonmethylotrophicum]